MTQTATMTVSQAGKEALRSSKTIDTLLWLSHGAELAYDLKATRAKHSDVVWQLLVEAIETIDKMPDQEKRWLSSGSRSGWRSPGLSRADLVDLERIRLLSAIKPFDDDVTRLLPQGRDEDRALGVLEWLRWVNAARSGDRLSRAATALARGGDSEIVQRIYCPGRKPNRQNVREVKVRTIGFILTGLRDDLGIVQGDGISFRLS
ncbi:hypothetical protein SG09_38000 [Bradyrhizobium ottawaense]|uniref:hypothetical protein n=1 Tax=Bradyrhizobium ottawaense TaxID=931866 RepID=UPI00126063E1|nr:hypothetical protein [Bradyrhizobium ottawaense]BBO04450.1 hypothetical protein SG09_38000 [Bradyrhizobium ottawaense]